MSSTAPPPSPGGLVRSLGVAGATGIGLASMIGAGAFFVWAPASAVAGAGGLLIALLIAAVVATLNALSSAQLAMAHPVAGGTYSFGRRWVGPWTGFVAGWLFVTGKTASAAAIASIAGAYLWPEARVPLAVGVLAILAVLNMTGIRATARVSMIIVTVVLAGLAGLLIAAYAQPSSGTFFLDFTPTTPYGVLQAAALLFFAFAGYARMATLGEEVRDPRRTLPRAILLALAITLALYAVIALTLTDRFASGMLAASSSPLADLLAPSWRPLVAALAGIACLGSLVAILAGLSRTSLAMARAGDLPGPLARVSPRTNAPVVAEGVIAAVAVVIVLLMEPAQLVAASSAAVLLYYAIAHLAALRQEVQHRWQPRAIAVVGLLGCVLLVAALPWSSLLGTAALLAVGLLLRLLAVSRGAAPPSRPWEDA
ncbi:MAG: APC family permease [Microcella sp.]|uniref:APC family permease n=1 Tax=Microcella sp. TaxID=1913979 RepID=UPI00331584B2